MPTSRRPAAVLAGESVVQYFGCFLVAGIRDPFATDAATAHRYVTDQAEAQAEPVLARLYLDCDRRVRPGA